MPKVVRRSSTPDVKYRRFGYGHPTASIAGLQVIQYRSYQQAIYIYHVRTHLLPLSTIHQFLRSQNNYRGKLTSFDPIQYSAIIDGDEIPPQCIEAAYMPAILHGRGSALALRSDQESGKVEWLVFSGPIDDDVLSQIVCVERRWVLQAGVDGDDARKVFDLVGYAEKGLKTRSVKGANREHKGWHDSLLAAKEGKLSLKLTWRKFDNDLRDDDERQQRERSIEE